MLSKEHSGSASDGGRAESLQLFFFLDHNGDCAGQILHNIMKCELG
jgi:hypothetical protein